MISRLKSTHEKSDDLLPPCLPDANLNNLMYIDKQLTEFHFTKNAQDWPDKRTLIKKIQLTDHFIDYMRSNLLTAGSTKSAPSDDFARIPYLKKWLRVPAPDSENNNNQNGQGTTDSDCIAFLLTNGTFQCNFHKSHYKVVICPLMKAVTFISYANYDGRTFGIEELAENGCDEEPFRYLRYALNAAQCLYRDFQKDQERLERRRQNHMQGRMGN